MKKDNPEKAVQRQFGHQAACYAVSRPHATGTSLGVMLNWGKPTPADRVLDIATGTGFTAFTFAEAAGEVVATDITTKMLQEARRLAVDRQLRNIRFLQVAAEALPFRDKTFDITTCRIAPHHFASVPAFLREIHRILRPTGRFVLTDSSSPEEPEPYTWHQEIERLRDADAGLTLDELTTSHRTELVLSDWVRTSGSPPDVVAELRRRFTEASPAVREAFRIREVDGDFHFSWMLVILLARPA
jgi:ubiquinone/menaquinone biosynthesis C-methylase UbiE